MVAAGDRETFEYEVAYVLETQDDLGSTIVAGGTPVHPLGSRHHWDLRWTAALRRLLLEGRFDLVHFHLPYTAAVGRLVVRSLPPSRRPAVVYTEHSLWNKTATPVRWLNRATIGSDDALVVVSDAARDALPGALRARAQVVVHGLDLSQVQIALAQRDDIRDEVRAEIGVPPGALLVLTVANLRAEKGYDVLLDAVRLIVDRDLALRFAAVGWGSLEQELGNQLRRLGLGRSFQFLGQRTDVLRLLIGADIFVLASRHEGLPVSLMEAMSVGLAIVATEVGGIPRVVTDDVDALLVAPGDPAALADVLERVGTDPSLRHRLGEAAKARSTIFDISIAARSVEDIYRRLAADRAG